MLICVGIPLYAASPAETLCHQLERHLQSLQSLELRYEADGPGAGDEGASGRIVWVKPDRFLHDTPGWTLCEIGDEQWRYLKQQNTLIRERVVKGSEWRPEDILFHASSRFRPVTLEEREDGARVVTLHSETPNVPGEGILEFGAEGFRPTILTVLPPDGADIRYVITEWIENAEPEAALFDAPDVSPENLIDFRTVGSGK